MMLSTLNMDSEGVRTGPTVSKELSLAGKSLQQMQREGELRQQQPCTTGHSASREVGA